MHGLLLGLDVFFISWWIGWLNSSVLLDLWLAAAFEWAANNDATLWFPNRVDRFLMTVEIVTVAAVAVAVPVVQAAGWRSLCDRFGIDARRLTLPVALATACIVVLAFGAVQCVVQTPAFVSLMVFVAR